MPYISLDVHATTLIDAQLSLSFSQLSDVLRLVIEQSNNHERQIQDLHAQLQTSLQRNDALAQQLADALGGASAHSSQTAMLTELSAALQLLREDVYQLKNAHRDQSDVRAELAQLKRQLDDENHSTSVAFSTVQEKWSQLSHTMKEVQPQAQFAAAFAGLWGATPADVENAHQLEASAQQKYIHSLPPMAELLAAVASKGNTSNDAGDEWVAKSDWAEQLAALKSDLASLQSDLTALQRQRYGSETIDGKLKEIEEKLRVLDATKADHLSLSIKTDKDTTNGLAQRVNHAVNEIGTLSDRIDALVSAATSVESNPPKKTGGTIASPPVIPSAAPLPSEELRRRVAALETEVTNLETKKADRSEMTKLYDALDTLTRNSPLGLQTTSETHASPPQPPKNKPPSARGSRQGPNMLDHVAVVDSHFPPIDLTAVVGSSRGSSASPRRVTPSRPLFVGHGATVGIRDSSGGMTPASVTCVSR